MIDLRNKVPSFGLFGNAVSFPELIIINIPATIRPENGF
jgi:hypothetical protein